LYLVLAGAERFMVEFVRVKDDRLLGPFSVAQGIALLVVIAGAVLLRAWRDRAPEPAAA
jgi:prolipoprotein diacylglyceryltransferase